MRLALCAALALACLASAAHAQAPAPVTVSNATDLAAALKAAQPGAVIKLAPGAYADLNLYNTQFGGVTITSADTTNEAVFSSLTVNGSSGISFDHLNFQIPTGSAYNYGITIANGSDIHASYLTVTGQGTPGNYSGYAAVLIRGESNVSITNSDISHTDSAIAVIDSEGVTLTGNSIHNLSQDGIDSSGSSNEVISGNTFTNFETAAGVHPDAIQFFADQVGVGDTHVVVADNVMTRGAGNAFQGVFVAGVGDIQITGNAMAGTLANGIALGGVTGGVVSNNFVEGFTDVNATILTRNQSSNVSVTGNVATSIAQYLDGGLPNPGYVESGNTIIPQAAVGDYSAMNAWLKAKGSATPSPPAQPAPTPAPDPLQPQLDAANAQVAADQTTIAGLNAKVTALTAQLAAAPTQATVDALNASVASLKAQLTAVQTTNTATALKAAQTALATANAALTTWRNAAAAFNKATAGK